MWWILITNKIQFIIVNYKKKMSVRFTAGDPNKIKTENNITVSPYSNPVNIIGINQINRVTGYGQNQYRISGEPQIINEIYQQGYEQNQTGRGLILAPTHSIFRQHQNIQPVIIQSTYNQPQPVYTQTTVVPPQQVVVYKQTPSVVINEQVKTGQVETPQYACSPCSPCLTGCCICCPVTCQKCCLPQGSCGCCTKCFLPGQLCHCCKVCCEPNGTCGCCQTCCLPKGICGCCTQCCLPGKSCECCQTCGKVGGACSCCQECCKPGCEGCNCCPASCRTCAKGCCCPWWVFLLIILICLAALIIGLVLGTSQGKQIYNKILGNTNTTNTTSTNGAKVSSTNPNQGKCAIGFFPDNNGVCIQCPPNSKWNGTYCIATSTSNTTNTTNTTNSSNTTKSTNPSNTTTNSTSNSSSPAHLRMKRHL